MKAPGSRPLQPRDNLPPRRRRSEDAADPGSSSKSVRRRGGATQPTRDASAPGAPSDKPGDRSAGAQRPGRRKLARQAPGCRWAGGRSIPPTGECAVRAPGYPRPHGSGRWGGPLPSAATRREVGSREARVPGLSLLCAAPEQRGVAREGTVSFWGPTD